jgi:murein DD-endopeptidase MepM/ murein hydrolase activator NlpD
VNRDGILDQWRQVVTTTERCADNFWQDDRMGKNRGGPAEEDKGENALRLEHSGVDIQANEGDPIYSISTGTVTALLTDWSWDESKPRKGEEWEKYVEPRRCGLGVIVSSTIDEVEYEIAYCHLSSIAVASGVTVGPNTLLGHVGMTGNADGYHLHITMRIKND